MFFYPPSTALTFPLVCVCFLGSHNRVNQCPVNEHGCLDPDVCIHMSKLCDGTPDCSDGWDEGPHCRGKRRAEASFARYNESTCRLCHRHPSVCLRRGVQNTASHLSNRLVCLSQTLISNQQSLLGPFNEFAGDGSCDYNGILLSGGRSH